MEVSNILDRIGKESKDQISKNKVKINRFVGKYKDARKCFYSDDETDDLYDLLFDIATEYELKEEEVYFIFVESKYTLDGEFSKSFDDDFATHITLLETINTNKND